MRFPIKGLMGDWNLANLKTVRRVVVSVIGATVLLIGVALLVLPGPAFIVIPAGLAILATEYAWARRWLRKGRQIATDVVSGGERSAVRNLSSSADHAEHEKRAAEWPENEGHEPR